MTIAEDMALLRGEIELESESRHEAAIERKEEITGIKNRVRDLKEEAGAKRKETKLMISGFSSDRKKNGEELKEELKEERNRIRSEVKEFREETGSLLKNFASERYENKKIMMEEFRNEKKKLKDDLSELRKNSGIFKNETKEMLRQLSDTRKNETEILKESLKNDRIQLKNDIAEERKSGRENRIRISEALMKDISEKLKEISESNSELKDYTHTFLNNAKTELGGYAEIRNQMHNDWRKSTVNAVREGLINIQYTHRGDTGPPEEKLPEETAAQEISIPEQEISPEIIKQEKEEAESPGSEISGSESEGSDSEEIHNNDEFEDLTGKIYDVIQNSGSGVSLRDIGENLDIEWRKLIRPAKKLLDDESIKKVDVNYFPV